MILVYALFDGRRQLIVYRAFLEPGVFGWPDHACPGCSLVADQVAHLAHLNARDTTLAFASRAPKPDIERLKARMDWTMPWFTMTDNFDTDFGVPEWHGTNAFIRDGDSIFRTYFVNNRGDEALGSTWSYLDLTALGRQEDWEDWEDSPDGYPQTPAYGWWRWHDEYGDESSWWWSDPDSDSPDSSPSWTRPIDTAIWRRHLIGSPDGESRRWPTLHVCGRLSRFEEMGDSDDGALRGGWFPHR